jgi:hypothetical protein
MRTVAYVAALIALSGVSAASDSEKQVCNRGDTPIGDLVVYAGFSENLRHHSLDGAPAIPDSGVVVPVTCTVAKDGSLSACNTACADPAVAPYAVAALARTRPIRVRETLNGGGASAGRTTTINIRFAPTDRFTLAPLDFMRGDLLILTGDPKGKDLARFYPIRAMRDEAEAVLDVACVVREDLSADCPYVAASVTRDYEGNLKPAFEHAARRIAKEFRVAPQTSDGRSPIGIWFRKRIRFVLQ